MATINVSSDNLSRNHMTRRAALHGAACVAALAVPAGAAQAMQHSQFATDVTDLPGDVHEPLIAMWAEGQRLTAECEAADAEQDALLDVDTDPEADARFDALQEQIDALFRQISEVETRIATTAPVSPEGLAIIAAVLLAWQNDGTDPGWMELDQGGWHVVPARSHRHAGPCAAARGDCVVTVPALRFERMPSVSNRAQTASNGREYRVERIAQPFMWAVEIGVDDGKLYRLIVEEQRGTYAHRKGAAAMAEASA